MFSMKVVRIQDFARPEAQGIFATPIADGDQSNVRIIRLAPGQALPPHHFRRTRPSLSRSVHGDDGGSAVQPVLRTRYQCLLQAGKPKKVALVACMHTLVRTLNAILCHMDPRKLDAAEATGA
jgi:hypothetical protein